MSLTKEQEDLINHQLERHHHERYQIDLVLGDGTTLEDFVVAPSVLRPEGVTAHFFAKFLFANQEIYKGKRVLDIGSGTGIQGTVMGKYGATEVVFTDISPDAVANTKENIRRFGLEKNAQAIQGDLFENVSGKFDLIIFNHPFFPGKPVEGEKASIAMLDEGELLERFLRESPAYLEKEGVIIMPYFLTAGDTNNPGVKGPLFGYGVRELTHNNIDTELHKGEASVFELTPPAS